MGDPASRMAEFIGHNGRFAGGRVHSVALQPWIDDQHVPGPACRTPSGTFNPSDFKPTTDTLSCKRCKKWHPHTGVIDPNQFALGLELTTARTEPRDDKLV